MWKCLFYFLRYRNNFYNDLLSSWQFLLLKDFICLNEHEFFQISITLENDVSPSFKHSIKLVISNQIYSRKKIESQKFIFQDDLFGVCSSEYKRFLTFLSLDRHHKSFQHLLQNEKEVLKQNEVKYFLWIKLNFNSKKRRKRRWIM